MKFVLFYHSLVSDWNHGNAHFLRGVVSELQSRGHRVDVYEPADGWSLQNLRQDEGNEPLEAFKTAYPGLRSFSYELDKLDLDAVLDDADVVIMHEWNEPRLVAAVGRHRAKSGQYRLLFHDTHHRSVTAAEEMKRYHLEDYDGVLAFGEVIREIYLDRAWTANAWTWHEAADTRVFRPREHERTAPKGDLVWIGNWGDEERNEELRQYLIEPVRELQLDARVHGVRYPRAALRELSEAGIFYGGWLANYRAPEIFSRFGCTVHIPRRPYREQLPGVPTIRVFEALACGIPLVCLRWEDSESLFTPGQDYLLVDTPEKMTEAIHSVLTDQCLREELTRHGRQSILDRHTCTHRVDELFRILTELDESPSVEAPASLATKG